MKEYSEEELRDIFEREVNDVRDLYYDEDGDLVYETWPGEDLSEEIIECLEGLGFGEEYNLDDPGFIEFIDWGNEHEYVIHKRN